MSISKSIGGSSDDYEEPTRDIEQGWEEGGNEEEAEEAAKEEEVRAPLLGSSRSLILLFALILSLGVAACGAFLSIGISSASREQREHFLRSAIDLGNSIENVWEDYVHAASIVHSRVRSRDVTRQEFAHLYEYLVAGGLDFQAVQFVPNVTRSERESVEAEARAFYAEKYPHVNYRGIVGFEKTDNSSTLSVQPRSQQDYYFPVHYTAPVLGNEAAIDLDLYSSGSRKTTVSTCLKTGKPALTDRLRLVQETEEVAYGFVLLHPGIKLSDSTDPWPRDLVSIVIRVPDLLARSAANQGENWSVYLYDKSDSSGTPLFLGAAHVASQSSDNTDIEFLPETPIEATREYKNWHEQDVVAADKVFSVVVVNVDDTFDPNLFFVILCGVVIFVASFFIAIWVVTTTRRMGQFNALKAEASTEKSALILEHARQIAQAERGLNDFISHEVRNPLSAAMAACSFVKSSVQDDSNFSSEETKKATTDDIYVIETSLKFVNDLLRSMFDINRATNRQLKLEMAPANVLRDILAPVEGMLYERGGERQVIVECPTNLVVMTDRLRLEQVILNIAKNSQQFVEEGFIRLRGAVVNGDVQLSVEDSGSGIPVEKRGLLFNKYNERLDVLSQGTGIGLFLCKNLVEHLGGEIGVDETYHSEIPDRPGSRFVINLKRPPITEQVSVRRLQDTSSEGVESGDKLRTTVVDAPIDDGTSLQELPDSLLVMFVDDDPILRKLFSRMVKKVAPNWTIREAADGETALKLTEEDNFDLIFMDQYMASTEKRLLGTETVAFLRERGLSSRICGLSANDKEAEFLMAGANVFSQKPFPCEPRAMSQELLRILNQGRDND